MRAALHHTALIKHHNLVRMADSGQAMRNNQRRAPHRQLIQLSLYLLLSNIIQGARGLIQHHHRRIFEKDACNRQALLLPSAQLHAALSHLGVITGRQLLNKLIRRRSLRCCLHLVRCRVRLGVGDVIAHAVAKKKNVLLHQANLPAQ